MRVALLTVAAIVTAIGLFAQAPQEGRFRASIDTVSIYATVNDADGRLVPDLVRDDFTVLDNGVPREITFFSSDVQPITAVIMTTRGPAIERPCWLRRRPLSDRAARG